MLHVHGFNLDQITEEKMILWDRAAQLVRIGQVMIGKQ